MDADVEEQQLFRRDNGNFPKAKGIPPVAAARDVLREQKATHQLGLAPRYSNCAFEFTIRLDKRHLSLHS